MALSASASGLGLSRSLSMSTNNNASSMSASAMHASAAVAFVDAENGKFDGHNVGRNRVAEVIRQRELLLQRELEQLPYFWGYMTAAEVRQNKKGRKEPSMYWTLFVL